MTFERLLSSICRRLLPPQPPVDGRTDNRRTDGRTACQLWPGLSNKIKVAPASCQFASLPGLWPLDSLNSHSLSMPFSLLLFHSFPLFISPPLWCSNTPAAVATCARHKIDVAFI